MLNVYKVKYRHGRDILIKEIEAVDIKAAVYVFYMLDPSADIISIELKGGEE